MKPFHKEIGLAAAIILLGGIFIALVSSSDLSVPPNPLLKTVELPVPIYEGTVSVEESLSRWSSTESYSSTQLSLQEVSQLLWAARGKVFSDERKLSDDPAGNAYSLEIYLVASRVEGLARGVYRYISPENILVPAGSSVVEELFREKVSSRRSVKNAPALLVLTAHYDMADQGPGERRALMAAGYSAQSVCLQAYSLDLGTEILEIFDEKKLGEILDLGKGESPLCILPVGRIS